MELGRELQIKEKKFRNEELERLREQIDTVDNDFRERKQLKATDIKN